MQRFSMNMAILIILLTCNIVMIGCSTDAYLRINGQDRVSFRKSLDAIESSLVDKEKMRFRLATIVIFNEARKLNPDDPNAGMRRLLNGKTYQEMIDLSLQVGKKNFDALIDRDKKNIKDMVDSMHSNPEDAQGETVKDPDHIKKLSTRDIKAEFITNAQSGRLFIVTGKLHNGYSSPIEYIQIRGELYIKGGRLSQSEVVYAGIKINERELTNKPVVELKKRLRTLPTNKEETARVLANQDLDFMIVFSDLPEALDEYDVEPVVSSIVH